MRQETSANEDSIIFVLEAPVIIFDLTGETSQIFLWSVKKKAFNSDLSRCVAGVGGKYRKRKLV